MTKKVINNKPVKILEGDKIIQIDKLVKTFNITPKRKVLALTIENSKVRYKTYCIDSMHEMVIIGYDKIREVIEKIGAVEVYLDEPIESIIELVSSIGSVKSIICTSYTGLKENN